jgi:hypothetical protein
LSQDKKSIFAPKIKTLRNKHQNPFIINYSFFFRWLYYMAVKYQLYSVKYFIYAVNGLVRRLFIILVHIFKLKKTREKLYYQSRRLFFKKHFSHTYYYFCNFIYFFNCLTRVILFFIIGKKHLLQIWGYKLCLFFK